MVFYLEDPRVHVYGGAARRRGDHRQVRGEARRSRSPVHQHLREAGRSLASRGLAADPGTAQPDTRAQNAGGLIEDPQLHTLVAFTRALVRNRCWVPETGITGFFHAGYSRAAVLEVIAHIGLKVITNYVDHTARLLLDAAFEPQRWERKHER